MSSGQSGSGSIEFSDLGLAAYLRTRGFRCSGVKNANPKIGTGTFVFMGDLTAINTAVVDYQDSPEKRFDDAMRYLKTMCKLETRRN